MTHKPELLTLVVIEHNPILLEGIAVLLGSQGDILLAGSASTSEAGIGLVEKRHPDVTLLDLDLPRGGALDAVRRILAIDSRARIIALATYELDPAGRAALAAGVAAIVAKDQLGEALVDLIRTLGRD